jgi:hypothetical protein
MLIEFYVRQICSLALASSNVSNDSSEIFHMDINSGVTGKS